MKEGLYGHTILETDKEALETAKDIQKRHPSNLLARIIHDIETDVVARSTDLAAAHSTVHG